MEILTKQVPDNFNLFLISDDHEGNIMRYNSGWEAMLHMVNSDWNGLPESHNYVIDGGDFCEGLTIDHPYYRPETVTQPIPALQVIEAKKHRRPILSKLVCILDGNHPMRLWKFDYMTQRLCYELDVPFGTLSCKVHWLTKDGELMFKSYHIHGRRQISSVAGPPHRQQTNMLISLQNLLKKKASDCFLMCRSHTHKLLVMPPAQEATIYDTNRQEHHSYSTNYIDQTAQYIHIDDRWYVSTGSFLKLRDVSKRMVYTGDNGPRTMGISSYAEAGDYDPLDLGFAIAEVRDRKLVQVRMIKLLGEGVEVDPPIR